MFLCFCKENKDGEKKHTTEITYRLRCDSATAYRAQNTQSAEDDENKNLSFEIEIKIKNSLHIDTQREGERKRERANKNQ